MSKKTIFYTIMVTLTCLVIFSVGMALRDRLILSVIKLGIRFDLIEPKGANIYQDDDTFGFKHRPNSAGYFSGIDKFFCEINERGERFIPVPEHPTHRVIFLGGSFTFGHGVEDHETFASILARHWPNTMVQNKGVDAWGTAHAYLMTHDVLQDPPDMVFYVFIPHHIIRNYIRRDWFESIGSWGRTYHPHFEIVEGKPKFMGIATLAESREGTEAVAQMEIELTKLFVLEMAALYKAKGVKFVLIFLPSENRFWTTLGENMFRFFQNENIEMVDLRDMKLERISSRDRHPAASAHKQIAKAISEKYRF